MVGYHPYWEVFDLDEFCKAVPGQPSELSSRLLVMVVFAYELVGLCARLFSLF